MNTVAAEIASLVSDIAVVVAAPETEWKKDTTLTAPGDETYIGTSASWRVYVFVFGQTVMGTATRARTGHIVRLTDELAHAALTAARRGVAP